MDISNPAGQFLHDPNPAGQFLGVPNPAGHFLHVSSPAGQFFGIIKKKLSQNHLKHRKIDFREGFKIEEGGLYGGQSIEPSDSFNSKIILF